MSVNDQRRINSRLYWIAGQIQTCDSKHSFAKQSHALICALKFKKHLTAYRCPVCNEWHLTKGITK
jgi:hypothetical protein